jgi:hypothetical protein
VQQNLFRIEVGDETAYLRADCGVFPGSSVGNHLFGLGAWPVQRDWITKRRDTGCASHLEVASPFDDGATVNTACTVFADDCGSTTTALSLEQLVLLDRRDDAIFDNVHLQANMKQNADKAVRQMALAGPGAEKVSRAVASALGCVGPFSVVAEARYLGPYLHANNSYDLELVRRISAMHRICWMWRGFWTLKHVTVKTKAMFFKGIVLSTVLSAVTAFVLSKNNYNKLNNEIVKKIRYILNGKHVKDILMEMLPADFQTNPCWHQLGLRPFILRFLFCGYVGLQICLETPTPCLILCSFFSVTSSM